MCKSLGALQDHWGERKLASFAAAATSAWRTDARFHGEEPAYGSKAGVKLADWSRFNDGRVLKWARTMVDAIREGEQSALYGGATDGSDAGARGEESGGGTGSATGGGGAMRKCHRTFMRLNNALLLDPRIADHGIDRSALARMLDLHGKSRARWIHLLLVYAQL